MTFKLQALNADATVFAEITFEMPVAARNRILDAYREREIGPVLDPANPPVPMGRKGALKKMARDWMREQRAHASGYAASVASRAAIAALTPDPDPVITETFDNA